MADILIKNTKMPDCCNHCFYVSFCGPHALTVERLRESVHEQIFDLFGEMRLDGCPLVEVKERYIIVDGGNGHANARKMYAEVGNE